MLRGLSDGRRGRCVNCWHGSLGKISLGEGEKFIWGRMGLVRHKFYFLNGPHSPGQRDELFSMLSKFSRKFSRKFFMPKSFKFLAHTLHEILKSWLAVSRPVCHKVFRQPLNFGTMLASKWFDISVEFISIRIFRQFCRAKSLDIYFQHLDIFVRYANHCFCWGFCYYAKMPRRLLPVQCLYQFSAKLILPKILNDFNRLKLFSAVWYSGTGHAFI